MERGHIALARIASATVNRTLVRDVVQLMLRHPGSPAYIRYDRRRRRLYATAARPSLGAWRQVGPYDMGSITVLAMAQEVDYLAQACRDEAASG